MLTYLVYFFLTTMLLYAPGIVLLKLMRCNALTSVGLAPIPTLAYYVAVSHLFPTLGIRCSALTIAGSCLFLFLVAGIIIRALLKQPISLLSPGSTPSFTVGGCQISRTAVYIGFYLIAGLGLYAYLFCRNAGSADMFLQNYDNVTHIAKIRLMADNGIYSSFLTGSYDMTQDPVTRPTTSGYSFYPALWHSVGAMVFDLMGGSITTLVNALNGVLVAVVFPLSMLALMTTLFPDKPRVIMCGCLTAMTFEAYPWGYLAFGPLYPNLASLSIMPAVWTLFILSFKNKISRSTRVITLIGFFCGALALAFSQPNALFVSVLGLTPFCIYKILKEPPDWKPFATKTTRRLIAVGFVVFVICIWIVCYNLPSFSQVVSFDNWRAIASKRQVIVDILTLALADAPSQLFLGLLVLIGVITAWKSTHRRWIVASYILFAFFYGICASFEGPIKHLLCGFWYCDPFRLAANMPFFGAPLAALGLAYVGSLLQTAYTQATTRSKGEKHKGAITFAIVAASIVLIFYPNFAIKGVTDIHTAFGFFEEKVQRLADQSKTSDHMLPEDEQQFLDKVAEYLPENALLINQPFDGSVFAYGVNDLNTYYRYVIDYGLSDETETSILIRNHLNEIATNKEVQEAVAETGAEYILLLDVNNPRMKKEAFDTYLPDQWRGIDAINDSTPGLTTVLSEGDMRLYRIDSFTDNE